MTDKQEPESKPEDRSAAPPRRPWHAPQFITTDIASTDTQGNAGTDGGPTGSLS